MNIEQFLDDFEPRYMESYHQCEQCPSLKTSHSQLTLSSPLLESEPTFPIFPQRAADLASSIYSDSCSPPLQPTKLLLESIETSSSRLLHRRHTSKSKKSTVGNPYYRPSTRSASSIPTLASLDTEYHHIKRRNVSVGTDSGSDYESQASFSSIESFLSLDCEAQSFQDDEKSE
ncbi:predicted protein [Meyerozyma guilliermondii ATCC 6260]|uniref:Uncharacterized protein n=1 Tax=Meyerozyma guilliermondii (strain ATCC 6260 / CBS 566 / DSM 6381 / JCM 1539 / NBRC 10279 / NRRL Y-324) TaxID=294746 RepID=A5DD24_PICGU|nr:uncharacterized protein PGUG_01179 [Meyerozyma guilliermondii ATCC 6260]EDK37081.2 predicted protein [Meyerozyma guilliermondii ATCC 6260]